MNEDEWYRAVVRSDENYDGVFFYGVKSTGIYCRPSCRSKPPLRKNIRFFSSAAEARAAGFRPCKRCRSDLLEYHPIRDIAEDIRRRIDDADRSEIPPGNPLRDLGFSGRRTVDIFKEVYGVTPKAYADSLKLAEAKRRLAETSDTAMEIALCVGFGSLSSFNRFFRKQTGTTPAGFRKKART